MLLKAECSISMFYNYKMTNTMLAKRQTHILDLTITLQAMAPNGRNFINQSKFLN